MGVVGSGQITLYDANDAPIATLSNEMHAVPSNADGSNPNLSGAVSTLTILLGGVDITNQYSVTATPSSGVTGSLSTYTYTVSGMTVDSGYVDFSASKTGFATLVRRFSLGKSKQGTTGTAGTPGSAAPRYLGFYEYPETPSGARYDDVLLHYSTGTNDPATQTWRRAVKKYNGSAWVRTAEPLYINQALRDINDITSVLDGSGSSAYGPATDYGVNITGLSVIFQAAYIKYLRTASAIIDILQANGGVFKGTIDSPTFKTNASSGGQSFTTPAVSYYNASTAIGSILSPLANGTHAASGTLHSKTITSISKNSTGTSSVSLYSSDADVTQTLWWTDYRLYKSYTSTISGVVYGSVNARKINWGGIPQYSFKITITRAATGSTENTFRTEWSGSDVQAGYTFEWGMTLNVGDTVDVYVKQESGDVAYPVYVSKFRIFMGNASYATASGGNYYVYPYARYVNGSESFTITGVGTYNTSSYFTHWIGSSLLSTMASSGIGQGVSINCAANQSFAGKTVSSFVFTTSSATFNNSDGSTTSIASDSYYSYSSATIVSATTTSGVVVDGDISRTSGTGTISGFNLAGNASSATTAGSASSASTAATAGTANALSHTTNAASMSANGSTSYGAWRVTGGRNGYTGINLGGYYNLTLMQHESAVHGGIYNESQSKWLLYGDGTMASCGYPLYGAVGNDYADKYYCKIDGEIEYGKVYVVDSGKVRLSGRYNENGVIGITTNEQAFTAGDAKIEGVPVSVGGFVQAKTDKKYPVGTPLVCGRSGLLTKARWYTRVFSPHTILAFVLPDGRVRVV